MRRKMLPTRRRAALRWTAAALLVLLLLLWLGPRRLTPEAAHRQELALLAVEPELVLRTQGPEDNQLLYSWNDDFLCLGAYYRLRPWEWNCRGREIVQREEGRPFAAGMLDIYLTAGDERRETRWRRAYAIFGRIEAEDVSRVVAVFVGNTDDEDGWGKCRKTVELEVSDMMRKGEHPWFLQLIEPEETVTGWSCAITAYDAEGHELGTLHAAVQRWE